MLAKSKYMDRFFRVNVEASLIPSAYGVETLLLCDYHRFMREALRAGKLLVSFCDGVFDIS